MALFACLWITGSTGLFSMLEKIGKIFASFIAVLLRFVEGIFWEFFLGCQELYKGMTNDPKRSFGGDISGSDGRWCHAASTANKPIMIHNQSHLLRGWSSDRQTRLDHLRRAAAIVVPRSSSSCRKGLAVVRCVEEVEEQVAEKPRPSKISLLKLMQRVESQKCRVGSSSGLFGVCGAVYKKRKYYLISSLEFDSSF